MATELRWNYPSKLLKKRDYIFQKLYARDYKTYRKKIGDYTIWLWEVEKRIEVDNINCCLGDVVKFWKNNKQHCIKSSLDFSYLKIQYNTKTGDVQLFDYEEYNKIFKKFCELKKQKKTTNSCWDEWKKKYKDWREEVLSDDFENVIKEIEILCNYGKSKKN